LLVVIAEGSSATDSVTDVTDVSPMSVGRWKKEDGSTNREDAKDTKEEGRGKREK